MELHLFQSAWGLVDINPFGMKVDAFMQLTHLEYSIVYDFNAEHAPRGELPYLVDQDRIIGDSSQIIDYLIQEKKLGIDTQLSPRQKASALCVQRTLEEHLYSIILYSRMVDVSGLDVFKQDIFSKTNNYREEAVDQLSQQISEKLALRGIGRYSYNEIYQMGIADLEALSHLMSDEAFFFSPQSYSIDTTIYAFLENIRAVPIRNPLNKYLNENEKLIKYCNSCAQWFI